MEKSERELLSEINDKMQQLLGIAAASGRSEDEQIQILRNMNFDWRFIGIVTGLNADAAKKRFQRMSKNPKEPKNGKVKPNAK